MARKTKKTLKDEPKKAAPAAADNAPDAWRVLAWQAVFWLIVWSLFFVCMKGCSAVFSRGLPSIRIEWPDRERDATPLATWIKKNRPGLEADYPAVGTELRRTAERLESGRLVGPIDAAADTIAREQPEVSDAAGWREFISQLTGRFQGEDGVALAAEYRDAAGVFGVTAAVESLIDIAGGEDEESTAEDVPAAGAVDGEGQDESEDQPVTEGPSEPVDEENRRDPGCPTGQCPARAGTGYGYGWGYPAPYYRLF